MKIALLYSLVGLACLLASAETPSNLVFSAAGLPHEHATWSGDRTPSINLVIGDKVQLNLKALPEHDLLRLRFKVRARQDPRVRALRRGVVTSPRMILEVDKGPVVAETSFGMEGVAQHYPDLSRQFLHKSMSGILMKRAGHTYAVNCIVLHDHPSVVFHFKMGGQQLPIEEYMLVDLQIEALPFSAMPDEATVMEFLATIGGDDPLAANQVVQSLLACGPAVLPRLMEQVLTYTREFTEAEIRQNVENLDHAEFELREKAKQALKASLTDKDLPLLRELWKTKDSPEFKLNLKDVGESVAGTTRSRQALSNRLRYLLSLSAPDSKMADNLLPAKLVDYTEQEKQKK